MKKIKTTIVLLFLSVTIYGQTEKGKFVFGGDTSISFTSEKTKFISDDFESDNSESSTLSFLPGAGYFVIDNLAMGLQLQVSSTKQSLNVGTSEGDPTFKTNTLSATPFLRYYFTKGNIKPYIQGKVGAGSSKFTRENTSNEGESKNSLFIYGVDGGVAIFINSHIAINLGVGYSSIRSKDKENNDNNARTISKVIGVGAGFNVFL